MSEWAAKRFWTEARVVAQGTVYAIELDGRGVRTPAKAVLQVPTHDMAQAVADEWAAQGETIDPLSMPVTRSANAALDKVGPQRAEVVEMLAAYAGSDMLCYRAAAPDALASHQAEAWDPYLDWSAKTLDIALQTTTGVMPVAQPADSLARVTKILDGYGDFELAAMHDLIALSGSIVLAFAVSHGHATSDQVWPISRLDELWQQQQWGADEEAESMAAVKEAAFHHAARFLTLARG